MLPIVVQHAEEHIIKGDDEENLLTKNLLQRVEIVVQCRLVHPSYLNHFVRLNSNYGALIIFFYFFIFVNKLYCFD